MLYQPAEWQPHKSTWTAFPCDESLWQDNLILAQEQFVAMCKIIAKSEQVNILVANKKALEDARLMFKGCSNINLHLIPYGDIWLRDTMPIWLTAKAGKSSAIYYQFNGWGGKYKLKYDDDLNERFIKYQNLNARKIDLICEGGAIEVNGEGVLLTTRQCLLSKKRNPQYNEKQIEDILKNALGVKKILWIDNGLLFDHTDGHIDNIARFIAPNHIVCMRAESKSDVQYEMLESIYEQLSKMTNINGSPFKITAIPSPSNVENSDGDIMPASYLNFYITNSHIIVPIYGTIYDEKAIKIISSIDSDIVRNREVIALPSDAILTGGGSFHCITQQEVQ